MSKKLLGCLLLVAACSSTPPAPTSVASRPAAKPVTHRLPASLVGEDRQQQEALQAFLNSCSRLGMQWQSLCWQAQRTAKTPAAAARFFQQNFDEYALDDDIIICKNEHVLKGVAGMGDIMTKDVFFLHHVLYFLDNSRTCM